MERRLDDAATELERERRCTTDEIDALQRFEKRVRSLDVEVREAYESTVMAVPHYETEYDDTYRKSLAAEFDAQVAVALTDGAVFGERCKEALLAAVTESVIARRSLLAAIDEEGDSLSEATDELTPVAESLAALSERAFASESFGGLDAYRARLGQLEATCEDVLTQRQRSVFDQRRTAWLPADAPDVARYFYQPLDDEYPVIAVIADLLKRIQAVRRRVERAMTFCHA